jgi:ubiquinone/menaquinone biosynthesis C-methylase UbiE
MKKEITEKILKETEVGYDLISEKFSQTRNRFWGGLEFINKYIKGGGKVLDFGCGNGRLTEILKNKNIDYVGVDISGELINLAKNSHISKEGFKDIQFLKINHNIKKLPFPSGLFDSTYSIAVFHHLPSKKLRIEKAKELYRVTNSGGYVVVTVWDLWQKRYVKNIFQNWKEKIMGKTELDWNDCWVTFTDNQGKVFKRYHHAFTRSDLRRTFQLAGFSVKNVRTVGGNIVLIGKKQNK